MGNKIQPFKGNLGMKLGQFKGNESGVKQDTDQLQKF